MKEPGMQKLNEYAKVAEAAQMLGVSQNTLRKWADEGRIPVRVNPANGYRLFHREEMENFLSKVDKPSTTRKNRKR